MGRWNIQISAETYYPDVEAETQEEAILKALDWFIEYEPDIICEEVEEEEPMVIFDLVPSSPKGQFRIGKEWSAPCEHDDEEPCCADCGHKTGDGYVPDSHCYWCEEYSEFERKNW